MEEFIQKLITAFKFPVAKTTVLRIKRSVVHSVKAEDVRDLVGHMRSWRATEMSFDRVVENTCPMPQFRTALKERLIHFIELKHRSRPFFTRQRRVALALSFFVLFVGIFAYLSREDLAKAQHLTYLAEVFGDVAVGRDGKIYRAQANMILREGDIVRTAGGARATVQFFDDSISRLDADTEVFLEHLSANPLNTTNTVIALSLRKGRAYNRVISLINGKSKFTVRADDFVTSTTRKAAFDVSIREEKVEVTSLDNAVSVEVGQEGGRKEKKSLLEGTKAKLVKQSVVSSSVTSAQQASQDEVWIEENLKEDEEYIAQVQAVAKTAREKEAGILPGDMLYPVKVLAEKADVFLTFNRAEKSRKKLEIAKQKLVQAQVLLERGSVEDGKVLLLQFKTAVLEIAKDAQTQESVQGENLKAKITETLERAKKDLAPVLPDSQMYEAKTALKEAELQVVIDDKSAVVWKKLQQAQDSVSEAKDLADKEQPELAKESLKKFTEQVNQAVKEVSEISDTAKGAVMEQLAEQKAEMTPVLDNLSQKASGLAQDAATAKQSFESVLDQAVTELDKDTPTGETLIIEKVKVEVQPISPSSESTVQVPQ